MYKLILSVLFWGVINSFAFSQVTWNGGTGDWNVAANWTPAGVPTLADDVTINTAGSVVTIPAAAVGDAASLVLDNGVELIISSTASLNTEGFFSADPTNIGVTINGGSTLTNSGAMNILHAGSHGIRLLGSSTMTSDGTISVSLFQRWNTLSHGIFVDSGSFTNSNITTINNNGDRVNASGMFVGAAGTFTNDPLASLQISDIAPSAIAGVNNTTIHGIQCAGVINNSGEITVDRIQGSSVKLQLGGDFNNLIAASSLAIADTGLLGLSMVDFGSTVTNDGTITIDNNDEVAVGIIGTSGPFINNATGVVDINNVNQSGFQVDNSFGLTNHGLIEITDINTSLSFGIFNSLGSVTNTGTITIDDVEDRGIVNFAFGSGGVFTNSGSVTIDNTNLAALANQGAGTSFNNLAGGSLTINNTAANSLDGISNEMGGGTVNDGNITINDIDGMGILLEPSSSFTNSSAGITDIINITTGHGVFNEGAFINNGAMTIDQVQDAVCFMNTSGTATFTLNGSLEFTNTAIEANDKIWNFNAATINGSGTFTGSVVQNEATISPGNSIGALTINGDLLSNFATALLYFEVDGYGGGGIVAGHDLIVVNGDVDITNATLETITNSFTPNGLDQFEIIDVSGISTGIFGTLILNNYTFDVVYGPEPLADPSGIFDESIYLGGILVLPVELTEFYALYNDHSGNVDLNWSTEAEINLDRFTLSYSEDAEQWFEFADVTPLGSASAGDNYQSEHINPLPNQDNLLYYRLTSTDLDGTEHFSQIVRVKFPIEEKQFAVYPNPAQSNKSLHVQGVEVESAELYDSNGRLQFQWQNENSVTLPDLASGYYVLLINKKITERIIVID